MALAFTTICDSISKLTVSGVTLKDIDEIPIEVLVRDCPILYPEPVNFVTELAAEMATFGRGAASQWNVGYNLTYTLLYAPVGSGRGMENFAPTIAKAFLVVDAILAAATLTGAVRIDYQSMSTPGPIPDPSGNMFFGVEMVFRVLEFVN